MAGSLQAMLERATDMADAAESRASAPQMPLARQSPDGRVYKPTADLPPVTPAGQMTGVSEELWEAVENEDKPVDSFERELLYAMGSIDDEADVPQARGALGPQTQAQAKQDPQVAALAGQMQQLQSALTQQAQMLQYMMQNGQAQQAQAPRQPMPMQAPAGGIDAQTHQLMTDLGIEDEVQQQKFAQVIDAKAQSLLGPIMQRFEQATQQFNQVVQQNRQTNQVRLLEDAVSREVAANNLPKDGFYDLALTVARGEGINAKQAVEKAKRLMLYGMKGLRESGKRGPRRVNGMRAETPAQRQLVQAMNNANYTDPMQVAEDYAKMERLGLVAH